MNPKKIHFMGLGGAGISAVAAFAKNSGFEISGCDIDSNSQFLKPLLKNNVTFFSEHNPDHITESDLLVVSPAIESLDKNNSEVLEAKKRKIPILIGEEFLAKYILGGKKVIAITGTHGKSTTTAMIGKILEESGLDPSVFVGAIVSDWGTNYRIGKGEYFVIEADEYQEKFLLYHPFIEVITAIEMDHPEYFKNIEEVLEAFKKFIGNVVKDGSVITGKGFSVGNLDVKSFELGKDFQKVTFDLKVVGEFNQENASLAYQVSNVLKISDSIAKAALEKFSGVSRRFELIGEEKGIKVYDDYGHHPGAIFVTSKAAREKYPDQKIWIIYQPHMFSRTKVLFNDFVAVFKNSPLDQIILLDIFAARQENKENITSNDIVKEVGKENVRYVGDFEKTADFLLENVSSGEVIIFMGAGDIYQLSRIFLKKLAAKT